MIKEHDCVVLTSDLPGEGLLSGDVGTVVHIPIAMSPRTRWSSPPSPEKTIAVATVLPSQCRPIGHRDVNHVARGARGLIEPARGTCGGGAILGRYIGPPATNLCGTRG